MLFRLVVTLAFALIPSAAVGQSLPFDPRAYQSVAGEDRTEVLVLGTPHLSGASDDFDPAVLEPLLARLEAFAPDLITLEALSGESLETLRAYRASIAPPPRTSAVVL